jgi:hypothetical protein
MSLHLLHLRLMKKSKHRLKKRDNALLMQKKQSVCVSKKKVQVLAVLRRIADAID